MPVPLARLTSTLSLSGPGSPLSTFRAGLRLGNAHTIVPMTTAASVGAYLLSTPVEFGLTAGHQLLPEAGAT